MKVFNRILTFGLFLILPVLANAQDTDQSFFSETGEPITNLPTSIDLEERKPIEYNNPRADDVIWQQAVYRIIDLREKMNYPLYFPEESSDKRESLFTSIFRLLENDKIRAYNYIDGKEIFTEDQRVNFDEWIKSVDILLTVKTDSITLCCKRILRGRKAEGYSGQDREAGPSGQGAPRGALGCRPWRRQPQGHRHLHGRHSQAPQRIAAAELQEMEDPGPVGAHELPGPGLI